MKTKTVILFFLLLGNAVAQGEDQQQIDQFFKSYLTTDSEAPVTAILVHLGNEKTGFSYQNGFGKHSLENAEQMQINSPFKVASITKMLTATLILQLVESGHLSLEDKAFELLKEPTFINFNRLHIYEGNSYGEKITIRQLLTHTSGLADIFTDTEAEFIEMFVSDPTMKWTPEHLFETYYKFELNDRAHFKPGQGYYYSDTNYFLLGLIIESLTEKSLAENYRSKILKPAKMESTYFEYHESPINFEAMPSTYLQSMELNQDINTSFDWAGGGLVSTTKDLSSFMRALFSSKLIKNKALFEQMITDTGNGYGMGISIYSMEGETYYGHSGYWGSIVCYNPLQDRILVLSINQSDPKFSFSDLIKKSLKFTE